MSLKDILAAATPGPWAVADETVIWTQINDPVETSYDIGYPLAETRRSKNIYHGSLWPTGQPEANAALIALAPDMAAALIEAEKVLERIAISNCGCKPHCRCREEGALIIWKEEAQDEAAAALATIRKVTT